MGSQENFPKPHAQPSDFCRPGTPLTMLSVQKKIVAQQNVLGSVHSK